MPSPLVATKLCVPPPRRGLVTRPRLVERLVSAEAHKLVLVCAPAGWAKTSLLGEWSGSPREPRAFAWVSLDLGDDDPVRFWSYVIAALRTIEPTLGDEAAAALPSAGAGLVDAVLPPLLNDLAALERPLVLVLDDYHSVHSDLIHGSIAYALRHLPPAVQIVLATRADPPLPLAGLRAAGDLLEIRAADLAFDVAETDRLLNGSLGLALEDADVELLQQRTEGWPAGLQLAALSVEAHDDKHAFVEAFAGDDRQVGDYLHEVLADQPARLREFLLRTSILDRLTAPLCDAVTEQHGSATLLEHAERSNLFLVPLDSHRRWYRYHHLFRDLLRHELSRIDAEPVAELHRRAVGWHRVHGDPDEAIAHATAAGDFELAAELIRTHVEETSALGRFATVARWIDALPASVARADPAMCARRAWCALHLGRLDEAAGWRSGFAADWSETSSVDDSASPEFAAVSFDAGYAARRGDVDSALRAARVVLTAFRETSDPRRAYAELNLGELLFYAGLFDDAAVCLEGALQRLGSVEASPNTRLAMLHGHAYLAVVRAELADVEAAARSLAEAERVVDEAGHGEHHPNAHFLHVVRGRLLALRGDLAAAEVSLERGVELHRHAGWPLDRAYALIQLATVKRKLRSQDHARALAREARQVIARCPDPGMLHDLLRQTERSLQLARGAGPVAPVDPDLSARELSVLRLLASELSQREIGSELYVSFNTVKSHTRAIFRKLGVSTRAEAVARGRELDLI